MVCIALSCAFAGWAVVYLTAKIRPAPSAIGRAKAESEGFHSRSSLIETEN